MMLALVFPLVAYYVVKRKSETAVTMPRHYLPDSVVVVTKKGKRVNDTVWHRVADFLSPQTRLIDCRHIFDWRKHPRCKI